MLFLGGPFLGHHNDPGMFNRTHVCNSLGASVPDGYFFLADGVYSPILHSWVHSTKFSPPDLRKVWGYIRSSVEHAFANVVRYWVFVDRPLRPFADAPAKKYEIAVLLTNFLNFFTPNQTAQRFALPPRDITEYIAIAQTHPVDLNYL
jgi:hypothetical protein